MERVADKLVITPPIWKLATEKLSNSPRQHSWPVVGTDFPRCWDPGSSSLLSVKMFKAQTTEWVQWSPGSMILRPWASHQSLQVPGFKMGLRVQCECQTDLPLTIPRVSNEPQVGPHEGVSGWGLLLFFCMYNTQSLNREIQSQNNEHIHEHTSTKGIHAAYVRGSCGQHYGKQWAMMGI
jgi:hypothetical protein